MTYLTKNLEQKNEIKNEETQLKSDKTSWEKPLEKENNAETIIKKIIETSNIKLFSKFKFPNLQFFH